MDIIYYWYGLVVFWLSVCMISLAILIPFYRWNINHYSFIVQIIDHIQLWWRYVYKDILLTDDELLAVKYNIEVHKVKKRLLYRKWFMSFIEKRLKRNKVKAQILEILSN